MKKFIFLIILLLIPLNVYAVSLKTLQSNTSQYIKVCDTQDATVYLETNSINVVRSSHPYYTLQAKVYKVLYDNSCILKDSYTVNYNYNRSMFALCLDKRLASPNATTDELITYARTEAKKDSGITAGSKTDCVYDLKGNFLYNGFFPIHSTKAEFETVLYSIANDIYYQYTECKEHFFG